MWIYRTYVSTPIYWAKITLHGLEELNEARLEGTQHNQGCDNFIESNQTFYTFIRNRI